jgi:hypothetical protein
MHNTVGKRVLLLLPTLRFSAVFIDTRFTCAVYIKRINLLASYHADRTLTNFMKKDYSYLKYCN